MKKNYFILPALFLHTFCLHAQVYVVNKKGTILSVDSSKWILKDSNSYNKNRGNVGIGTNGTANSNAALEIKASDKGLLIPRLALTATTVAAPLSAHVAGMMVYNTATAGTAPNTVTPGFYYSDGMKWIKAADAAGLAQADSTDDGWKNNAIKGLIYLAYKSDGTARADSTLVVADDGKVGIGRVPGVQFDVYGAQAYGQFKRVNNGPTNPPGFLFSKAGGAPGAETNIAAGAFLGKVQFAGRIASGDSTYSTFAYKANSTTGADGYFTFSRRHLDKDMMTISTLTGNVGIGVVTPGSRLSVLDSASGAFLQLADFYAPANTAAGNNSGLRFGVSNTSKNSADIRFNYRANSSDSNRIDFGFNSIAAPQLSIQAGGKVGIGTTGPTESLDVNGGLRIRTLPAGAATNQLLTVSATGVTAKASAETMFIPVSRLVANEGTGPRSDVVTTTNTHSGSYIILCDMENTACLIPRKTYFRIEVFAGRPADTGYAWATLVGGGPVVGITGNGTSTVAIEHATGCAFATNILTFTFSNNAKTVTISTTTNNGGGFRHRSYWAF